MPIEWIIHNLQSLINAWAKQAHHRSWLSIMQVMCMLISTLAFVIDHLPAHAQLLWLMISAPSASSNRWSITNTYSACDWWSFMSFCDWWSFTSTPSALLNYQHTLSFCDDDHLPAAFELLWLMITYQLTLYSLLTKCQLCPTQTLKGMSMHYCRVRFN